MTAPLTPPDCDLRDYPWMPLDCTRLLTSETWMLGTSDEKVAALTLWCKSWHQVPAGSLPAHDQMLAVMSEAGAKWAKVRDHALRGWIKCSDGRLYHPVVCEKVNESWRLKLARRERTEAARMARKLKIAEGATKRCAPSVTEVVTDTVTDDVGALSQAPPDKTRSDHKEEREDKDSSFSQPGEREAVAPSLPTVLPSSVTAVVGSLAAKLEGRARGQPFLTAKPAARTVGQQLAAVAKPEARPPKHAPPAVLAEARQALAERARNRT